MDRLADGATSDDVLRGAVKAVRAVGVPGALLSVAVAGGQRRDVYDGHAQTFADDGPLSIPLSARHAHDLGSVTKVVGTTAMVAALVGDKTLSLDTPVGRFIPDASDALADVTLETLMHHRAGLWEWWPTYCVDRDPIETVLSLPLRYKPGTSRHYSDLGFMLLGRIVETVTTTSIRHAFLELVADRAKTTGLTYGGPPAASPATASSLGDRIERRMVATGEPYPVGASAEQFDGWRTHVLVGEVNDGNAFHSFGGAAGHAGLFGTADGLHAFGAALLTSLENGAPWPAMPAFLTQGPDAGQLVGFRSWSSVVDGCAATVLGHPGFPGVALGVIPIHRASIVLATNRLHVTGAPAVFDPLWQQAIAAAHRFLHQEDTSMSHDEARNRAESWDRVRT